MKLRESEGKQIQFYNTVMVVKASLSQTGNKFSTILMKHPPLTRPALHFHPEGIETFFVLEGSYIFLLNGETIEAAKGDFILVPQHAPHKYQSGPSGGKVLVTTPAGVEAYFLHIADRLKHGKVDLAYEFDFAKSHGQVFLEKDGHWGK